jgi:hypothetical protein
MKYLCLAYYHEEKFDKLTPSERAAIGTECKSRDEELHATGGLLLVASLGATRETTSIRPRNGKTEVTDGPYVETKEQLGAFFLIEAADLNDAIRIASKHPAAQLNEHLGWGIEVRPIDYFEQATP